MGILYETDVGFVGQQAFSGVKPAAGDRAGLARGGGGRRDRGGSHHPVQPPD